MTSRRQPLMEISDNPNLSSSPAASSLRKSGRAVRALEKFVPDVASEAWSSSSKRKRQIDEEQADASGGDVEGEDDLSEPEESAAEVEVPGAKRRKAGSRNKPVARKTKFNGAVSQDRPTAVKASSRAKKGKKVAIADPDAEGLYAEVYTSGASSEAVASGWIERFLEDESAALTDLVNFILKSTGSPSQVAEDQIRDPDNISNWVQVLQDEFQEHAVTDYPLISKAKGAQSFRTALTNFIRSLINALHETAVIYRHKDLIENIIHWVGSMSTSSTRPFRHTATVVALTMASAVCTVLIASSENTGNLQSSLDGQFKKKSSNKARMADFQNRVEQGTERKEYLEERLKDIFEVVYLSRYRDVDPKIRVECVEALANWIHQLPNFWMDGQYLRYLGWMLTDSTASMRQEVIKQLDIIMSDVKHAHNMRHFFARFRSRIIEMVTQDADPLVRAAAVRLCAKIREAGFLEPDDVDIIGKLIFDIEPKVRQAVVTFFVENVKDVYELKVEELGGNEVLEEHFNNEDEDLSTPQAAWIKVKCLAEVLLNYDAEVPDEEPRQIDGGPASDYLVVPRQESRFTLAAQALYDRLPEVSDWEMLAGYLLYDHTATASDAAEEELTKAFRPEEQEEVILLEMLDAAVILSLTHAEEAEKDKKKSIRQEGAEAKKHTARQLADIIPRLLKKYGAAPRTASVVLRLEHALDLEVFQGLRQESTTYAKLLDEISAQFRGHCDRDVLNSASAALLHARGYPELEDVTESKVQSLWDDTISNLQKIEKSCEISIRGALNLTILTELSHTTARLAQLASISNCVDLFEAGDEFSITSILIEIVGRGMFAEADDDIDSIEDELTLSAAKTLLFYFMWKVRSLIEAHEAGENIPESVISDLQTQQESFNHNLIAALSSRSTIDSVRLEATGILLDVHVLLKGLSRTSTQNNQRSKDDTPFASLNCNIAPNVQSEILGIFTAMEKLFARKSKKPLLSSTETKDDAKADDPLSEPESEDDEEGDDDGQTPSEKQAEALRAEQQLCELTSKIVLGIIAEVVDDRGGKVKRRIQRNRGRLGPNFKEVVAFLDDKAGKRAAKKGHKNKAVQAATTADTVDKQQPGKQKQKGRKPLREEVVVEEEADSGDDPFAEDEPEEGTKEDLRRRGLRDDDDDDIEED